MNDADRVIWMGLGGLASTGIFGAAGLVRGLKAGERFHSAAESSNVINHQETPTSRRYTISPSMRAHGRFALLNILAGPTIMLARHGVNNLIWLEDKGETMSIGHSMFTDWFIFPIGWSSLSYSLLFFMAFSSRIKFGACLGALRRIF